MTRTYRLAVIGLVHDHVWNELKQWKQTGRVDLTAICESDPALIQRARSEFGMTEFYSDPAEMLASGRIDIVQICTSNAAGLDAVRVAADAGTHAVIEKPLAANLSQAESMLGIVENAGVRLFVNWPFRWRTPTLQAWEMVRNGLVGQIFNAKIRMAHRGPREFGCSDQFCGWLYDAEQNGAGALIDYCCYGAVASRYLFGMPQSVQAFAARLTKTDISVEDNASLMMIYPDCYVTAEASWSQIPGYHDSVYLGTQGSLWTERGRLLLATDEDHVEEITVNPLVESQISGPACFLDCLERELDFPDVCDPVLCRDAQEILQAGLDSNEQGTRLDLPLSG